MISRKARRFRPSSGGHVPLLALALVAVASLSGPLAGQTAPPPPENLEATAVSSTRVDLGWSPPDDLGDLTLSHYNVYRDGTRVASTSDTIYADTDLQPATTYRYYVTAVSSLGAESEPSDDVVVTTSDATPPTVPEDLRTTAVESTRVELAWSASSDPESGVDHYRVFRDGSGVATTDSTSFSDGGLEPGTTYSYRVSAVNGDGLESDRSDSTTVTTEASSSPGDPGDGDSGGEADSVPPAPPTGVRVER